MYSGSYSCWFSYIPCSGKHTTYKYKGWNLILATDSCFTSQLIQLKLRINEQLQLEETAAMNKKRVFHPKLIKLFFSKSTFLTKAILEITFSRYLQILKLRKLYFTWFLDLCRIISFRLNQVWAESGRKQRSRNKKWPELGSIPCTKIGTRFRT